MKTTPHTAMLNGLLTLGFLALGVTAQGVTDWGENTEPFDPPKQQGWVADSLFMGATFLRDTAKDFRVWFHFQEAGCVGALHLMVPGGKTNGGDTSVYLFNNRVERGTTVDFMTPEYAWVHDHIGHMDTIFFMYRVYSGSCDKNPRYTGPNRAPGDINPKTGMPFLQTDRYWSIDSVGGLVRRPDGTRFPILRRWCVAGWIRDHALNARTDTVEFGFEDLTPGDSDFDDIIFHVTGVFLIRPAVVSSIRLDAEPAVSTIRAGETVTYTATVLIDSTDSLGNHYHDIPDLVRSSQVRWQLVGDSAAVLGGTLLDGSGPARSNTFTATRAYKRYTIMATIIDDVSGQIVTATAWVNVIAADAARLVIEGAPDTLSGLDKNIPNPVTTLTIPSDRAADTVYAILRDTFGNFINPCPTTDWRALSGASIVSVASGNANLGQGIITKQGPAGNAAVEARDRTRSNALFADTVNVIVDPASYNQLRFVVGTGGQKRVITSLAIDMNADTLLFAEARRTDGVGGSAGDGWVSLNVNWSLSPGLSATVPPPSSSNQWVFSPVDTGEGTITIRFGSLSRTLAVTVSSSGPDRIALYARSGAPGAANAPYFGPQEYTYTRRAGVAMPLVAKVFDAYNAWLPQFESDPQLGDRITWQARDAQTGTLVGAAYGQFSTNAGYQTDYTARRAGARLHLIATYNDGQSIFRDTVSIAVIPGQIDRLVIEPTPDSLQSPHQENRLGQIDMPNTASHLSVYAILRDSYGNYIGPAESTDWETRNPAVVTAAPGPAPELGEGVITRESASDAQTWVIAERDGLIDSVRVIINSVTYDAIQIYVLDAGVRPIDRLAIRTDQDTTLYVRGKRSDNGQWVTVSAAWSSSGLTLAPTAPANAAQWSFSPHAVGEGRIIASRQGTSGIVADTVQVNALPGLAARLRLYAAAGTVPLPSNEVTGSIVAGRDTILVARLFDHLDVPVSPILQFDWTTRLVSGNPPAGELVRNANDTATFSSTAAHKVVDITASYPGPTATLSYSVRFRVVPDTAAHLFIEPSPTPTGSKLNESDELIAAEIQATDTVTWAYAVLRDRFGNFVSASPSTQWSVLDATIVEAFSGVAPSGEGVIVRRGREGTTLVIARDSDRAFLVDSLAVTITIAYDSLRIMVDDNGLRPVSSLQMRTDQDTSLFVQGKRSDNGRWEYVPARWQTSTTVATSPLPPQSSSIFSFTPRDTGRGYLHVSLGTSVPDTIAVTFLPGLPCRVVLYPRLGRPGGTNAPLPSMQHPVTLSAGVTDTLVAKVFDCNGVWLDWYETSTTAFSWEMEELAGMPPSGELLAQNASLARFLPVRAGNRVFIMVSFTAQERTFRDTVQYRIEHGAPHHLVLESSHNPQVSPSANNPVDTITMTRNMDFSRVYAILRDRFENWVGYSTDNIWTSLDTAIVAADDGNTIIGEGIIARTLDRNSAAITRVAVTSRNNPSLTDTVVVSVLDISYDSLKIAVVTTDTLFLDSLTMTTNDDTTLAAFGLRSDTKTWEAVQVRWGISDSIQTIPSPPELAQSWRFSPRVPVDRGLIWIASDDTATAGDTVAVRFNRGPPLRAFLQILTPASALIAGQPIRAVVRVENRDGPVPGSWCFLADSAAMYRDRLGDGGLSFAPTVTVSDSTGLLNVANTSIHRIDQCFDNGLDTVTFVIYHAPLDSTHQISVLLGGMVAFSQPFTVLPAEAQRVVLVDRRDGSQLPDTLVLNYPGDAVLIEVRGYDRFGNPTGAQQSLWETSGEIPAASPNVSSSVYYTVSSANDNGVGTLQVTTLQTPEALQASVVIRVEGFYPDALGAITRDTDGNGYLDRIDITFAERVTLDDTWAEGIAITHDGFTFHIDSIGYGPDQRTVYVYLRQDSIGSDGSRAPPQTSWTPAIALDLFDGQLQTNVTAVDGAGPVIWSVTKTMTSATDRSSDRITITFSEKILANNNSPGLNFRPADLFTVWERDPITGEMREATGLLNNINDLFNIVNDSTIEFIMVNGLDLKTRNFISINTHHGIITDNVLVSGTYNPPADNNRLVSVVLVTPPPEPATIYPNPALPALTNAAYPPGSFAFTHEPGARTWARSGKGMVLSFTLPQPSVGERITGHLKIYDATGNLVASGSNSHLLEQFSDELSAYDIDVYWNGTNAGGMPVAPGIYRYVIYLSYQNQRASSARLYGNIGIRR